MNGILRWTVGDVSEVGFSILEESIRLAKKNLAHLNLDMVVCSNSDFVRVQKICSRNNIHFYESSWDDFPLPKESVPSLIEDDVCGRPPRGRQGSFWKLCPPRLNLNSHELVCDNDLLIQNSTEEMELFFLGDKTLLCEDEIYSLGKYTKFVGKPYNSGLYGLPPGFNFKDALLDSWNNTGSMSPLLSRDEQGLISTTLIGCKSGFLTVPSGKICMAFDEGSPTGAEYFIDHENGHDTQKVSSIRFSKCDFDRDILHFIGANRKNKHRQWRSYRIKAI